MARRRHLCPGVVLLAVALAGCGDAAAPRPAAERGPAALVRSDGDQQSAPAGQLLAEPIRVRVNDISGRGVAGVPVRFSVSAGGGWVVDVDEMLTDTNGEASTEWYVGPRAGGDQIAIAQSPVGGTGFRAYSTPLVHGVTYSGAHGYVEFRPGALPLILSAARGGTQTPASIPDRTAGETEPHPYTAELVHEIADAFERRIGAAPSTVVVRLARARLDADAELLPGAQGAAAAERAWREYHGFIAAARAYLEATPLGGLYVDVHGAAQEPQRLEIGYHVAALALAGPDTALNHPELLQRSSIRSLATESHGAFAHILRGPNSLGALFAAAGVRSLPSPAEPEPGAAPYAHGGYSTARHGSSHGGRVNAVYFQTPFTGVRATTAARRDFADAFVDVMDAYFRTWFGAPVTGAR